MGDAPGALGGAIPWDKTLRGCCVLLPKRTILVCASVGIRARDVTLMVSAEGWLWVREMVAAKVVVGERDGDGDGSGVGEMREGGENFRGNWF